jgi:hypothetical protein
MVFFDAHVYEPQVTLYETLLNNNIIDDNVLLSFHDTDLHPQRFCNSYFIDNGWCHQPVERKLVEYFKTQGFDAMCFHTNMEETTIPFRHGITLMKKYQKLIT